MPVSIGVVGDNTTLFLGDNTFCYPNGEMTIGSCRAYLQENTNLGDVNGDGSVSVTDVTLVVNRILGLNNDIFIMENADINSDGDINVTDVTALVNLILGHNNVIEIVVKGADGLTIGGFETGPARVANK